MKSLRLISPILNALPAFEAAARTKSFTKAAENLGMAQPSVSRFISNLELHIGSPLFKRSNNRITLTAEGEKLYEATQLGLGHIRSVIEELGEVLAGKVISIGCTHGFAHMWLLPRIESLQSRLPETEIRVITMDHVANYSAEEIDLTIRFGDGNWPDDEAHLLFKEKVFPVCSPAFVTRHNLSSDEVNPEDLPYLPLLVQETGGSGWLDWQQFFVHFDIDFVPAKEIYPINNYAFILQAAMEAKGIALAWDKLAEPHLSNKWLIQFTEFQVETGMGYYLVFSKENSLAETIRAWIEEVA